MAIGLAVAVRNNRLTQIINAIDAGAAAGTLKFYTGPRPATGAAITTETLLGTLTFSDPSGTVTDGVLTFNVIADDTAADATDTAEWARVQDSDSNFVMDLSVTLTGGGGDIELSNVNFTLGVPISITTGELMEANA